MKLAVLSDIHSNWPALQSVISDLENDVDGYLFVGDYIGLLGYPSSVVQFAMENAKLGVKGNHDISVVENKEGHVNSDELSKFELETTLNNLNNEQKNWISNLSSYEEDEDLGIILAHAKPSPELSSGLERGNAGLDKGKFTQVGANVDTDKFDYVIVGHSHNQEGLNLNKFGHDLIVINPGTVGGPGNLGVAEYAVIDTHKHTYELRTVEYDMNEVINHLDNLDVPVRWWL